MMHTPPIKDCKHVLLSHIRTIKDAITNLNESAEGIVLVTNDQGKLMGTISDGDIRRAIIQGRAVDAEVSCICNRSPKTVSHKDPPRKAEDLCMKHRLSRIPVLDEEGAPVGFYALESFLEIEERETPVKSNPVVIMAGGKGTRLEPFTRILPKPLIPIGDKAVVEVILDRFTAAGFHRFLLSVNYRKEFIWTYFKDLEPLPYSISYVEESKPLDTIGSISLMKESLSETFIVANCDMLLNVDWDDALQVHRNRSHAITMLGALKAFRIPYGVVEIKNETYNGITEKPEFNFLVNLGVYIMEPEILGLMETGAPMKATTLIDTALKAGFKVGVYPIYNDWFDVGQWEEYSQTLKHIDP